MREVAMVFGGNYPSSSSAVKLVQRLLRSCESRLLDRSGKGKLIFAAAKLLLVSYDTAGQLVYIPS